MDEKIKELINFLAETFALRDSAMQSRIAMLETANLQLSQQVAWYRGAMSGGSNVLPGATATEVQ